MLDPTVSQTAERVDTLEGLSEGSGTNGGPASKTPISITRAQLAGVSPS